MLIEVIMFWTPSVQICDHKFGHIQISKKVLKEKKFQREFCPYGKVQNPLKTTPFQRKLPTKLGFQDITIF